MTPAAATFDIVQIHHLLAENGYEVTDSGENALTIKEMDSGIMIHAVLQGSIMYFSLNCLSLKESEITPAMMKTMLAGDNGISTSHFQLYPSGEGEVAVTLNNFCTLQDMQAGDEDDILSCVHYLLVDVLHAQEILGNLK
jgi:hypothetical protein